MTSLLRRNTSNLVIGIFCLTPNLKLSKENLPLSGCALMRYSPVYDNGVVNIKTIDDGEVSFVVNGHRTQTLSQTHFQRIFSIGHVN
jgi:hypothetical protein